MVYRPQVANRITRMIVGDAADPRPPQATFLVPAVVVLILLVGFTPALARNPLVVIGAALVALATVAAFWVPWARLPMTAMVAVPLLDLAAIGLWRLNPEVGAVGVLVVFPAMWLGRVFLWRGVVIVTLGSIVALTIPGFLYFGMSLEGWSRAVLLPIVAFASAYSMYLTAQVWIDQRADQERQAALLARALERVTEQQRLAEGIMSTADVGLLALGADGTYNSMNPRHQEFLEVSFPGGHAGRAGQTGYAFRADRVTALEYDEMPTVRAMRGDTFSDYTIWIGKDPESRCALSVSARPMLNSVGEFDGAVLAYKDITELMRALRVKDEFVASVSHELRTPLTSIIGYVDLINDHADTLPEEVNRFLDVIGRNTERLLLLVSDLLTTAQAEEGTIRFSKEPTDLNELVRLAVIAAEPRIVAEEVQVNVQAGPPSRVSADPVRLAQVVENLLSNAIKYTPAGGVIDIVLGQADDEVLLTVSDNGIGISEADQTQMFTKFFRAGTAKERAIPGVGLGLVITKMIIEGHGGSVRLDSSEGSGTTVRVRLPAASASVGEPQVTAAVPGATDPYRAACARTACSASATTAGSGWATSTTEPDSSGSSGSRVSNCDCSSDAGMK